jgi:hypothetical protein
MNNFGITYIKMNKPLIIIAIVGLARSASGQDAYSYSGSGVSGGVLSVYTVTNGQMLGASGNTHTYNATATVASPGGLWGSNSGTTSQSADASLATSIRRDAWINLNEFGDYTITAQGSAFCTNVGRTYYDTGTATSFQRNRTPSDHTYPNNPFYQACRLSRAFDTLTGRGTPHRANDVV